MDLETKPDSNDVNNFNELQQTNAFDQQCTIQD